MNNYFMTAVAIVTLLIRKITTDIISNYARLAKNYIYLLLLDL